MAHKAGRHFLQIPGPTNVPDRVLRAIDAATLDHRGPDFQRLGQEVLTGLKRVFRTDSPVIIFPASGTGAWEAALCNTLSPGDKVLMYETGHFATLWHGMATKLGVVSGVHRWRLAPRRRSQGNRGAACKRRPARDQGCVRGAQRNFDRGHVTRQRGTQGDRSSRASCAADRGHHFIACVDGLSTR